MPNTAKLLDMVMLDKIVKGDAFLDAVLASVLKPAKKKVVTPKAVAPAAPVSYIPTVGTWYYIYNAHGVQVDVCDTEKAAMNSMSRVVCLPAVAKKITASSKYQTLHAVHSKDKGYETIQQIAARFHEGDRSAQVLLARVACCG